MLTVSEECLEVVEQIKIEAQRYIKKNKKMPVSFAVTKRELKLVKEARRAGIIPEVVFKGEKVPVSIRYGGYYG